MSSGSLNKVMLIGRLGRDVDFRYTQDGKPVARFSIATNEYWNDNDGETQERTQWHTIVAWGKLAETCSRLLKKGRQVFIEGKLQTRSWEDKDGNRKYTTEVVAVGMQLLGDKPKDMESMGSDEGKVSGFDEDTPPF